MRILLVAEESAGMRCLRDLMGAGQEIVGVAASQQPADAKGANVWDLAGKMGLRRWPGEEVKRADFARVVEAERVDVILNVHSLHVIHEAVLASGRFGGFNLHPGPLPRYAGLNAPSWAIYNGETGHRVTLHKMAAGIDTGSIVFEAPFDITETDTGLTLFAKCMKLGLPLVSRLIEALEQDPASLPLVPQDRSQRRYYSHQVPHNGTLCWALPAERVARFIRASDFHPFESPWGRPKGRLNGADVEIVKAKAGGGPAEGPPGTVTAKDHKAVTVACLDEAILIEALCMRGEVVAACDVLEVGERFSEI